MIVPVILCGGAGTRLWPLSRHAYPKQLLPLVHPEYSLLQETILRIRDIPQTKNPIVICNEVHRFLIAEQLQTLAMTKVAILLEPVARNTTPAITIAALQALASGDDPLLLVLPADHVIKNSSAFQEAVASACQLAAENFLVTFGIQPSHPETGYGYIQKGTPLKNGFRVKQFVEKPNLTVAQNYLASGEYFWNSGMFLFRASNFIKEVETFAPTILKHCRETFSKIAQDLDFYRLPKEPFAQCENISIDYAIMEKSQQVAMVTLDAAWSDVGSWDALLAVKNTDQDGNVVQGDTYLENVKNSYIHAENRMLAVVGVSDHVVVETADAVLVAHKDHCQAVKSIVAQLKNNNRSEVDLHRRVYRPWGYYEILDGAEAFQVKRIVVKPGGRLSLQSHQHRSEHWVVISGIARVTRGEEVLTLLPNQSTYIPINEKHRLENLEQTPLVIIEVQCGDLISEEDIVRYEDQYKR